MNRRSFLQALALSPLAPGLLCAKEKLVDPREFWDEVDDDNFKTVMYVNGKRAMVWNRQLTDFEIKSLYKQPCQIFMTPVANDWQGISAITYKEI